MEWKYGIALQTSIDQKINYIKKKYIQLQLYE